MSGVLYGGLYALGLSSWRLVELARLPSDLQVHPDFPPWLMTYIWAICLSLFVIGGSTIVISILFLTSVKTPDSLLCHAAERGHLR